MNNEFPINIKSLLLHAVEAEEKAHSHVESVLNMGGIIKDNATAHIKSGSEVL